MSQQYTYPILLTYTTLSNTEKKTKMEMDKNVWQYFRCKRDRVQLPTDRKNDKTTGSHEEGGVKAEVTGQDNEAS